MLAPVKTNSPTPPFVSVLVPCRMAFDVRVAPAFTLMTVLARLILALLPVCTIEALRLTVTVPPSWNDPEEALTPPLALRVPPLSVRLFRLLKNPFEDNVPPSNVIMAAVVVPAAPQVSVERRASSAPVLTKIAPPEKAVLAFCNSSTPALTRMLGFAKVGVFRRRVPAPVLVSTLVESVNGAVSTAADPDATAKVALPASESVPVPLKVQLPLVVADPKLKPPMVWLEPMVMVSVTAVACPKKVAVSPEAHCERAAPSRVQKLSVPQVPLPDWKPAAVEVSHVTLAANAGVRAAAAARRKEVRTRDWEGRMEVGLCAITHAGVPRPVNHNAIKQVKTPTSQ